MGCNTLVEQNSCQTSTHNDCVAPQCQHQAVKNLQHSLGCGIPLGKGHSVVHLKKYDNVHLPGMVCVLNGGFQCRTWAENATGLFMPFPQHFWRVPQLPGDIMVTEPQHKSSMVISPGLCN